MQQQPAGDRGAGTAIPAARMTGEHLGCSLICSNPIESALGLPHDMNSTARPR
jgi:hypothetical protein